MNRNENSNQALEERATYIQELDRLLGIIASDGGNRAEEHASKIESVPTKQDDQGIINTTITAKMKTHDGGSQQVVESSSGSGTDAFSRYSNTNVRMMHLLGLDDDEEASNNEDSIDWQEITGYLDLRHLGEREANSHGRIERKTRLSTELHSTAFMDEIEVMVRNL